MLELASPDDHFNIAAQVLALVVWGHTIYLWVQGGLASAAAVALAGFWVLFLRRGDPRSTRWPPLLPMAAIAGIGAVKDFCLAAGSETPRWLAVLLLASVAWFVISSVLIWRAEGRSAIAAPGLDPE